MTFQWLFCTYLDHWKAMLNEAIEYSHLWQLETLGQFHETKTLRKTPPGWISLNFHWNFFSWEYVSSKVESGPLEQPPSVNGFCLNANFCKSFKNLLIYLFLIDYHDHESSYCQERTYPFFFIFDWTTMNNRIYITWKELRLSMQQLSMLSITPSTLP